MKIKLFLFAYLAVLLPNAAFAEFKFCNDTDVETFTAIAYSEDGQWTSRGWWSLEPGECKRPLGAELTKRFYYFHLGANDLDFIKGEFAFCTVNEVFEINGNDVQDNCADNGYSKTLFHGVELTDESEVLVTLKRSGDTGVYQIRTVANAPTKPNSDAEYLQLLQGSWSVDAVLGSGEVNITGNRYSDYFASIFGSGGSEGSASIQETCSYDDKPGPYLILVDDAEPDKESCYRIKNVTSNAAIFYNDLMDEDEIWYRLE
ncbi:MAG: DUF1036 domain-containing protein [Pseudomonadota bacterium]